MVYDVIVVGGGITGLICARQLVRQGKKVAIIEARDRWGGRVFTHTESTGQKVEFGGTWVGPTQTEIYALLQEYEIETVKEYDEGNNVHNICGSIKSYKGQIPPLGILSLIDLQMAIKKVDQYAEKIDLDHPWDSPEAQYLDSITLETFCDRHLAWTQATKATIDAVCRSVLTIEPSQISALQFLFYMKSGTSLTCLCATSGGAQDEVIKGGSKSLIDKLVDDLTSQSVDMILETPINMISQTDNLVTVHGDNATFEGKYVVMAMSPNLCGRMKYSPPLPTTKDQLFQRFPNGNVIKTIVSYERCHWKEYGFSGQIVSDSDDPIVTSFDHSHDGYYNIIGFCGGKNASKYRAMSQEDRKKAVCEQYARLFGIEEMKNPKAYFEKDWSADEYTRGCYGGIMMTGALFEYGKALHDNHERIYFGSTELSDIWNGYMDGAVRMGKKLAERILPLLE